VPTAAIADSGHAGALQEHKATNVAPTKAKGKKAKKVMLVFRGRFVAPGTVEVVSGNAHVR
jgi:hypothetical protein